MSPSPVMTRWAAIAIVCRPDEQKRLTVIPEVVTGHPARMAICRAMFRPVAPSGFPQPMITSSMSPGSTPARLMACCSTWPPIVAPWVMLSAPRQLLQSGVRAVETITASGIGDPWSFVLRGEPQPANHLFYNLSRMHALGDITILDLSHALAGPFAS